MLKIGPLFVSLPLALAISSPAWAEQPANGFGLYGGVSSHSMKPTSSASSDYGSAGLSLGIDYQFGVADSFSINPFLMSAGEKGSGSLNDTSVGHGILGVEGRYWPSTEYFIGLHLGSYSEVLQSNSSNVSTSASGGGMGLTLGWENSERNSSFGGLFVALQLDKAKIKYDNTDVNLSGARLHIGYRWK